MGSLPVTNRATFIRSSHEHCRSFRMQYLCSQTSDKFLTTKNKTKNKNKIKCHFILSTKVRFAHKMSSTHALFRHNRSHTLSSHLFSLCFYSYVNPIPSLCSHLRFVPSRIAKCILLCRGGKWNQSTLSYIQKNKMKSYLPKIQIKKHTEKVLLCASFSLLSSHVRPRRLCFPLQHHRWSR